MNPINENIIYTHCEFKKILENDPTIAERSIEYYKKSSLDMLGYEHFRSDHIWNRYNISCPFFWQEFYYIFYLSLDILKKYRDRKSVV